MSAKILREPTDLPRQLHNAIFSGMMRTLEFNKQGREKSRGGEEKKAEVGGGSRDGREVTPKSGDGNAGPKSQEYEVQRRK